ncbi:alpha/beta fold hydrolase [Flavobacterium sp. P21]|uniref:alpha/beta fold hydrolase n=1 Tax=Flavobacterium sp. P21 TaxID=3423948 RepID=UPI003D67415A
MDCFFESKGYKTVAPPWPYKNETSETLRQTNSNPKIANLRLTELVDYYAEIIEKLPEKPILIGHSYGGLLTQLLVQKELVSVGVCMHAIPPAEIVYFRFSFYKTIWSTVSFFASADKTYLMPFKKWQYYFANEMSFEEQKETYEKLAIPESKLVLRDILSQDFKNRFHKKTLPFVICFWFQRSLYRDFNSAFKF